MKMKMCRPDEPNCHYIFLLSFNVIKFKKTDLIIILVFNENKKKRI